MPRTPAAHGLRRNPATRVWSGTTGHDAAPGDAKILRDHKGVPHQWWDEEGYRFRRNSTTGATTATRVSV